MFEPCQLGMAVCDRKSMVAELSVAKVKQWQVAAAKK
jgi:hypothetical protein